VRPEPTEVPGNPDETSPGARAGRLSPAVGVVVAVYLLGQLSQLAVTPLGEGLDFFGHLSYVVFYAETGRPPSRETLSVPAWVVRLKEVLPGPDPSVSGDRYRAWTALAPGRRAELRREALRVPRSSGFVASNYEAQQPPPYYWLMSRVYRAMGDRLDLEGRVLVLTLLSECIAATGLLAIFLTLRLDFDERASLLLLLGAAWYPNLLSFLGRLTNDTLAFALIAWALYFACFAARRESIRGIAISGGLLVVAIFTKLYALTLVPAYLLCAAAVRPRGRRRELLAGVAVVLSGIAGALAFNRATTGHLLPLIEVRGAGSATPGAWLRAMAGVDPLWFFGGLVKGFWWVGDWSFVSPGLFYYVPILAVGLLYFKRPDRASGARARSSPWLWPHAVALGGFVAGLYLHAAAYRIYAERSGVARSQGNEGWYANVLLVSVLVVVAAALRRRVELPRFHRVLAGAVLFFMLWNLVGRVSLVAFWSGLAGRRHGIEWSALATPRLLTAEAWAGFRDLPGVLRPLPLTFWLPIGTAAAASLVLLAVLLRAGRAEAGADAIRTSGTGTRDCKS
jgi:hypothetical protein